MHRDRSCQNTFVKEHRYADDVSPKSGLLWLQVQALGGVPCRASIMQRPAPLPPAQVTNLLHPNVSDALRTAVLLAAWVSGGVRWAVGAVDRQNATGTQDDLKVGGLMLIRR